MSMHGGNYFFIDINTTTACSLRCKYCIEPFKSETSIKEELTSKIIEKFDLLLASDFMKAYTGMTIGFWGGEPTLNPKFMTRMIEHYADNNRVRFLVYSNGYNIDHIKPLIEKYRDTKTVDNSPKIFYQISYDGEPAHSINRLSVKGEGTAAKVRESIDWAKKAKISFGLKSTINVKTFKYMDECYLDVRNLVGNENTTYFPTIDYLTNIILTPEEKIQALEDLEGALLRMAPHEIKYFKQKRRFFFSWFGKNKALCSAGAHGLAVDTDGTFYKCHGIFYSDKKTDNKVTTVYSDTFLEDIAKSTKEHQRFQQYEPEECKKCFTDVCMRCNSTKYDISTKETFQERWTDYPNQPDICDLYRLATKIRRAVLKLV